MAGELAECSRGESGVSLGAFYRPSVRRAAGLPPVWLGRAPVAVPIAEQPEPVLVDWPDAPLPEPIPADVVPDPDKFPAVEVKAARGDRKTRRSTRAVSSALRAPIDLRSVRSAMDERAIAGRAAVLAKARDEALQPRPEGLVPCKCGGRQNGQGAGLVPDWFGRDWIEADCPLRGSK